MIWGNSSFPHWDQEILLWNCIINKSSCYKNDWLSSIYLRFTSDSITMKVRLLRGTIYYYTKEKGNRFFKVIDIPPDLWPWQNELKMHSLSPNIFAWKKWLSAWQSSQCPKEDGSGKNVSHSIESNSYTMKHDILVISPELFKCIMKSFDSQIHPSGNHCHV